MVRAIRSRFLILFLPLCVAAQIVPFGRSIRILPAVTDDAGQKVVFGSTVGPDGTVQPYADIYVANADGSSLRTLTQMGESGLTSDQVQTVGGAFDLTVSPDGKRAAYAVAHLDPSVQDIHVVDIDSGADRVVFVYTGCPQQPPATVYQPCISSMHFTSDGSKLLHASGGLLYLTNADGAGSVSFPLPGSIMASPQRVMTQDNRIVFANFNSPPPPERATFSVYISNLDGSSRQVVAAGGCDRGCLYGTDNAGPATVSVDGTNILYQYSSLSMRFPLPYTLWLAGPSPALQDVSAESGHSFMSFALSGDGSTVAWSSYDPQGVFVSNSGQSTTLKESLFVSNVALNGAGSLLVYNAGKGRISTYSSAGQSTLFAPRALAPGGFSNQIAESVPASPGSLASISGIGFSETSTAAETLPLPTTLAGVSVAVNGSPVPIQSVRPEQIIVLLPQETVAGAVTYQVFFSDGSSTPAETAEVVDVAPVVFSSCCTIAAAFHAGTNVPTDFHNPAQPGEQIEIHGTGLGRTNPPVVAGEAAPSDPLAETVVQPEVLIGGKTAEVVLSALWPGSAGVYQVNVIVPQGLANGLTSLVWRSSNYQFAYVGSSVPLIYIQSDSAPATRITALGRVSWNEGIDQRQEH